MSADREPDPLVGPRADGDEQEAGAVPERGAGEAAVPEREAGEAARAGAHGAAERRHHESPNMLPARHGRSGLERLFVRLIATAGVVGIGVAISAIMVSSKDQGWMVGLVVSIVSVVLAGLLWSSRVL